MMIRLSSILVIKGRRTGVFLFCLFSSFLYSQTIIGGASVHIQKESIFYISGEKLENTADIQSSKTEKPKIYVADGAVVIDIKSENIEIVEIRSAGTHRAERSQKLVVSKPVLRPKKYSEAKVKQTVKPFARTLKPISLQDTFVQINECTVAAAPVQNTQLKQFPAAGSSGQWRLLQVIPFSEDFFYEIPFGISSHYLSSFSVRPPPLFYYLQTAFPVISLPYLS